MAGEGKLSLALRILVYFGSLEPVPKPLRGREARIRVTVEATGDQIMTGAGKECPSGTHAGDSNILGAEKEGGGRRGKGG